MVLPILLYGAGIYGTNEHKILNTVQNKACRFYLGLPGKSCNLASNGDMGFKSIKCMLYTEVIRLWFHLKNMDPRRLTYKVFRWSYRIANVFGKKNLEYRIKAVFSDTNHLKLYNTDTVDNVKHKICQFQSYVHDQDCYKWRLDLWNDEMGIS